MAIALCWSCKGLREIVHTDQAERSYCARCLDDMPPASTALAMAFLAATIPYRPGDRVECRLGGQLYEGVGRVQGISYDLMDGGSPVYPSFRVAMEEKAYDGVPDEGWYSEPCLKKVPADD